MNPLESFQQETSLADDTLARPEIELSRKEEKVLALYEGATPLDWEDWRWQLRNRVKTKETLYLDISKPFFEQHIHLIIVFKLFFFLSEA